MNREFLMLAKDFDPDSHRLSNCFVSIKLDGQRTFWDGGISRGLPKTEVPWANNAKDKRYKEQVVATGLWSRYGNVVHAPNWFLDKLPRGVFLDGELYSGRGRFQQTRSAISKIVPVDEEWKDIRYRVFEMPSPNVVFQQGKINNPNFSLFIDEDRCKLFLSGRVMTAGVHRFDKTVEHMLRMSTAQNDVWTFLKQARLPSLESEARRVAYELLDDETSRGGEGLIIRTPDSIWVPKRVQTLLKMKKFKESEGVVVGYTAGKGKLLGMFGALVIQWDAKTFELSGFTDAERQLANKNHEDWARLHPGERYPGAYSISSLFPLGSTVRFRYYDVTNDGKPRDARYWR